MNVGYTLCIQETMVIIIVAAILVVTARSHLAVHYNFEAVPSAFGSWAQVTA